MKSPLKHLQNNQFAMPDLLKVLIIIIIFFPLTALAESHEGSIYKRPSGEQVRAEVRDILSNPDLKPTKTFLQWLIEKVGAWDKPNINVSPVWAKLLMSFLVIWCILTLVAILLHFLWSLWIITGTSRPNLPGDSKNSRIETKSYQELYEIAKQLAHDGNFTEAICIMMLALLRKLDNCGIIRFHESKTNSDYLREFPAGTIGLNEFKNFISLFEHAIYSGKKIEVLVYKKMELLLEQIDANVSEKA